jgi:hypothetical protein
VRVRASVAKSKVWANLIYWFFFFFFDMSTRVEGGGIRSCDLRFIRRGSQPIELPLGDDLLVLLRSW